MKRITNLTFKKRTPIDRGGVHLCDIDDNSGRLLRLPDFRIADTTNNERNYKQVLYTPYLGDGT